MSKLREDFRVNSSLISILMLISYRYGNFVYYNIKLPIIRHFLWFIYKTLDFLFVKVIGSADIPARCQIGKGLHLPHNGNGVIIHPNTVIGDFVTIVHQVTLGSNGVGNNGAPSIENHVYIGVGAKVLGRIHIGEGSRIGANAVVLKDVPPHSTAVGIPARVISNQKETTLRSLSSM